MNRKKSFNSPALWEHLLFLGPASIVFLIVIIIPFIISVGYSFTDWNGVSSNISFIGIKNFIDIFTGKSNFLGAFKFTFIIAICNVVCMNIAGIAIAALLTTKIPLQSAFRVVFYLPNIIGGLILGFVWQFIFINGVPAIGKLLHFGPLMTPWLGTEMTAYAAIVIVSVLNYGYSVLMSAFAREIVASGYLTQLGIFHDNMFNQFNLASDLMEPFRILIDREVLMMTLEVFQHSEKMQLVNVLNHEVRIDGKVQYVNNAIKIYCKSVFDALSEDDSALIRFYKIEL